MKLQDFAAAALVGSVWFASASTARAQLFDVGMFRPWANYGMPNGQWLTGDFDGDGDEDLFHAVANTDYVHVWRSDRTGGFAVSTFRPWAGYGISNGLWFAGRFNDDARTDVIHLVANSDYAHVWLSRGDGNFDVSTFRPWGGYGIPNGVWLTGNFDGDSGGLTDLFHAVAGTDYAHIWLARPNGTFDVRTFRPWSGYGIPNGVWRVGDFDGNGRDDIFHAVANTNYAHVWRSNGDGTFAMSSFAPWPGYGIPNGEWHVADFDADGRSDVLHVVNNSDYVHVWRSTGAGAFAMETFRPWTGYAVPNGRWQVGQLDGQGGADVIHLVQNSNYAHVWRRTGPGAFDVATFSPWPSYGIPNGNWLGADLNGDGKRDLVHLVGNGDYVHTWMSRLPRTNELSVQDFEVVQVIQDLGHTVPLYAGKATWVRVYLENGGPAITVNGTLRVQRIGGAATTVAALANAVLPAGPSSAIAPKRNGLGQSLNFVLPAGFTAAGSYRYSLSAINVVTGTSRTCANCTTATQDATFVANSPIRLRIVGLTYTTGTPPATVVNAPAAADFNLLASWVRRAYPTGQLASTQTTLASANAFPFTCTQANAELTAMRNNEIAAGSVDARTKYIGLVSNAGGFMRGCAPGSPSTVASGPTGNPAGGNAPINAVGDTDASFGDFYGGHELGHTFGRTHPGFCNGNSSDDSSFPNPNGQISDNAGTFAGLDVGDAANGIAPAILPGALRFDLMTYCNQPQWPSAYNYVGIRARQNTENPAGTGAPAASNLALRRLPAHLLPARFESLAPALRRPPTPVLGNKIQPEPRLAVRERPPLPSAAMKQRPELTTGTERRFDPAQVPSALPVLPSEIAMFQPPEPEEVSAPSFLDVPSLVKKGRFLSVVATVNLTKGTGVFTHVQILGQAVVPSSRDRRVLVRLVSSGGKTLAFAWAELGVDSDVPAEAEVTAVAQAVLQWRSQVAAIELVSDGRVLDRREVSERAPKLEKGETFTRKDRTEQSGLRWNAAKGESKHLTYRVEARANPKAPWETLAIGMSGTELLLDPATLARLAGGEARIVASNGFAESAPVVIRLPKP